MKKTQLIIYIITCIYITSLLLANVKDALFSTFILFFIVHYLGFHQIRNTIKKTKDENFEILINLWSIKLFVLFSLLFVGWIPELDPSSSTTWGYDPQRYYEDSWRLVNENWDTSIFSLNYLGVLYYYGFIFFIFGKNPVIPALINSFVTLIATLYLITSILRYLPDKISDNWKISFLVLIPEILWYDVMTSRETIMASVIIFATLLVSNYFFLTKKYNLLRTIFLLFFLFLLILAIRTTMLIPLMLSYLIFFTFKKSENRSQKVFKLLILTLCIFGIFAGKYIQDYLGGYAIDYQNIIENIQKSENNIAQQSDWSNKSVGSLFLPSNTMQSLIFLFPRMLLYIASPLPIIMVSFSEFLNGSWFAWQWLMTIITALLMLFYFPYVISSTVYSWHIRKTHPFVIIFPIALWINFIAVSGANLIIMERYRSMFTIFYFSCAWIGYKFNKKSSNKKFIFTWYFFLISVTISYFIYKYYQD